MVCHGASMETNGATRNHVWTTSEPRPLQVSSQLSPLPFPRPHLQPETLSNCQAILIDVNVHSQISQQLKETEMSWDVLHSMNWISRVPDHRHVSEQFHPAPVATSVAVRTSCIFVHESRHKSFRVATFWVPCRSSCSTLAHSSWSALNLEKQNRSDNKFVKW